MERARYGSEHIGAMVVAALLMGVVSCNAATPVRLEIDAAVLRVDGSATLPLAGAARVLDADGLPIANAAITMQVDLSRGATVRNGRITCTTRVDIPVRFAAGRLYADATVRCRPVERSLLDEELARGRYTWTAMRGGLSRMTLAPGADGDAALAEPPRGAVRCRSLLFRRGELYGVPDRFAGAWAVSPAERPGIH